MALKALTFVLLALPFITLAHFHEGSSLVARQRHARHSRTERDLQKRSRATFYTPQTGNQVACGGFKSDSDWIVAMNAQQFDQGGWCNKQITLSYNGKTAPATVVDRCESCGWGNIDLTPGLFSFLSDTPLSGILNLGILDLSWHEGGGDPPPPPPPPKTTHKTSSTQKSTHTHTSTSSDTPSPTPASSSKSHSSHSSTKTSTSTYSTTSTAASVIQTLVPSLPPPPPPVTNIDNLKKAVIGMGQIVFASTD